MATPRQIESARINGARSRGPKTPEGKRRSARNALKHGLTSRTIPLDPQSTAALEQMIADYTADILPSSPPETLLVCELAVAAFSVREARAAETAVWNRALAEYESFPARECLALAFMAISNELMQIMRHESRFERQYHVALTRLLALRENRAIPEKIILQNEPDSETDAQQPVFCKTNPTTPSADGTRDPTAPEESILQNEPDSDAPSQPGFCKTNRTGRIDERRATNHEPRPSPSPPGCRIIGVTAVHCASAQCAVS